MEVLLSLRTFSNQILFWRVNLVSYVLKFSLQPPPFLQFVRRVSTLYFALVRRFDWESLKCLDINLPYSKNQVNNSNKFWIIYIIWLKIIIWALKYIQCLWHCIFLSIYKHLFFTTVLLKVRCLSQRPFCTIQSENKNSASDCFCSLYQPLHRSWKIDKKRIFWNINKLLF